MADSLISVLTERDDDFASLTDGEKMKVTSKIKENPSILKERLNQIDKDFQELKESEQDTIINKLTSQSNVVGKEGEDYTSANKQVAQQQLQDVWQSKQPDTGQSNLDEILKNNGIPSFEGGQPTQVHQPTKEEPKGAIESVKEGIDSIIPQAKEGAENLKEFAKDEAIGVYKGVGKTGAGINETLLKMGEYAGIVEPGTAQEYDESMEKTFKPENEVQAGAATAGEMLPYVGYGALGGFSKVTGVMSLVNNLYRNLVTGTGVTLATKGADLIQDEEGAREMFKWDILIDSVASGIGQALSESARTLADKMASAKIKKNMSKFKKAFEKADDIESLRNDPEFGESLNELQKVLNEVDESKSISKKFKETVNNIDGKKVLQKDAAQQTAINRLRGAKNAKQTPNERVSDIINEEPPRVKKAQQVNSSEDITEMNIGFHPSRALDELDNLISSKTPISEFENLKAVRYFTDPVHGLTTKGRDQFKSLRYKQYLPDKALGDIKAENVGKEVTDMLKKAQGKRKILNDVITRFMEEPEIRPKIAKVNKDLAKKLTNIQKTIDAGSEELFQRGYLTPSARAAWEERYLARIYKRDGKLEGVSFSKGTRQPKLEKGRKISSIKALPEEDQKALGYIDDPVKSIKMTVAKQENIIALDDFYRGLIEVDGAIDPAAKAGLVHLSEKISNEFPNLPKTMSPAFAKKRLKPYLADLYKGGVISADDFKEFSDSIKSAERFLSKIPENNKFYNVGETENVRYGVVSGLPVEKTTANQLKMMTRVSTPDVNLVDKINKGLATLVAHFKIMNVPMNLQAYGRNYTSEFFKWSLSGGDPEKFIPETAKALRSLLKKDDFFQKIRRTGMLNTNLASEEMVNILKDVRNASDDKLIDQYFKALKKMSKGYGAVDDIVKMARVNHETKKGMDLLEAVEFTQDMHYDYAFVPDFVDALRSPLNERGWALKTIASPFATFTYKTLGFFAKNISRKPATLAAWATGFASLKHGIEERQRQKYKNTYEIAKDLTPSYIDKNTTLMFLTEEDGKTYANYVPLDYIIPGAELISYDNPLKGALEYSGFGQTPMNIVAEMYTGEDFFTDEKIRDPQASTFTKGLQTIGHAGEKFLVPSIARKIMRYKEENTKHPIAPKFAGFNIYRYELGELANIKDGELNMLRQQKGRLIAEARRNSDNFEEFLDRLKEIEKNYGNVVKDALEHE